MLRVQGQAPGLSLEACGLGGAGSRPGWGTESMPSAEEPGDPAPLIAMCSSESLEHFCAACSLSVSGNNTVFIKVTQSVLIEETQISAT